MEHHEILVDAIDPNPHRNFERNPIREDQVEKIIDSIGRTGFWDNVVVRPHPEQPGRYQLAYGHNRLDAIKRVDINKVKLPVAPLSDWDMYCAMVDENESQQEISNAIIFENVEVGLGIVERGLKAIGPKGTEEQFNRAIGRVVSRDTTSVYRGNGFEQVRNTFFKEGTIGKDFVEDFLPCAKMRTNTVATVLHSHYGEKKAEAKQKESEAKKKESEAKKKQAEAEKDLAKAEQLRQEAAEAAAEAAQLAHEARKIGAGTISEKVLLGLNTPYQMTCFAAAIKDLGIPKKFHQAAMEHVKGEETGGGKMKKELNLWFYEASGQGERDRQRMIAEEAARKFRSYYRDGDFKAFLMRLREDAKDLIEAIEAAIPTAPYYEDEAVRVATCRDLKELTKAAGNLVRELEGKPIVIELGQKAVGSNGHPKQLTS